MIITQVIQVVQVIQVMQVRLAHLWPDFRVIFLFSGLRDGRASPYQLNGGTKWVQYFFFDLRDDISYVQILYNAKWSYLCISDISAVLGNNNQKKIWFLDDNIWFDAVKLRKLFKKKTKETFLMAFAMKGGSRVPLMLFSFFA